MTDSPGAWSCNFLKCKHLRKDAAFGVVQPRQEGRGAGWHGLWWRSGALNRRGGFCAALRGTHLGFCRQQGRYNLSSNSCSEHNVVLTTHGL
jgi:hypothetical protein